MKNLLLIVTATLGVVIFLHLFLGYFKSGTDSPVEYLASVAMNTLIMAVGMVVVFWQFMCSIFRRK